MFTIPAPIRNLRIFFFNDTLHFAKMVTFFSVIYRIKKKSAMGNLVDYKSYSHFLVLINSW